MKHRVTIRKMYITNKVTGERHDYKWRFDCTCGAGGISWSWARWYDVIMSGLTLNQWMTEQGYTDYAILETGALPMALDHLRERAKEAA